MASLKKIEELIAGSDLLPSDQSELIKALGRIKDADLQVLLEVISRDPSWIKRLSDNHKAKYAALAVGSSSVWQAILDEEERQLSEIDADR